MRAWIPIAVASLILGCVHQPEALSGASLSRGGGTENSPAAPGVVPYLDPATRSQKKECERLLNGVLPVAEQMLSDRRELLPFAIALTNEGRVIPTSRNADSSRLRSRAPVAVLEKGLQQGAASGRYKATALVLDMPVVPPFKNAEQHCIAIRLDHRGGYSVIVFYPYVLGESGSLAIEAPFSIWGDRNIFPR